MYTEAQKKASIKYMAEKTDDIRLRVPKGLKDKYKTVAAVSYTHLPVIM